MEVAEEFPCVHGKYHRGLNQYRCLLAESKSKDFRHLQVRVYWGDAGTGKTRKAVADNSDYYILNQPDNALWWDGYEGQTHLIIDDFQGWVKYRFFLKVLDGYQLRLPVKGSFTYAFWTLITITSNKAPAEWYAVGMTPELRRRINEVTHFDSAFNPMDITNVLPTE